jgi:hypothetical protein
MATSSSVFSLLITTKKNKFAKRVILALTLIVLLISFISSLNLTALKRLPLELVLNTLAKNNISVALKHPEYSFLGLKAVEADVTLQNTILRLLVNDLSLSVNPFSLFFGKVSGSSSGTILSGKVNSDAQYNIFSSALTIDAKGNLIHLTSEPFLRKLGFEKCLFSFDANDFFIKDGITQSAFFSFNINSLSRKKGAISSGAFSDDTISPSVRLVFATIPELKNLNLFGKSNIKYINSYYNFNIVNLKSTSNLGFFEAKDLKITASPIPILEIDLVMRLSNEGLKALGPYLPLISANKLTATTQNFRVSGKGTLLPQLFKFEVIK